jgi:segregation and condensation protein A
MGSTYHVAVGSFSGPFDLLLQLIARRRLDVADLPLAQITDGYLAAIARMDELDLEVATDFLVVAATLVELKAARLLPVEEEPGTDELALEARDLLYARLLDYRVFRAAADDLERRLDACAGYVAREVGPDQDFRATPPEVRLDLSAEQFAALAAAALRERRELTVDVSHLPPVRLSVAEASELVLDELERAGGRATFAELTAGCRHLVEVLTCFLAMLELYKQERVELEQSESFAVLRVATAAPAGWAQPPALEARSSPPALEARSSPPALGATS